MRTALVQFGSVPVFCTVARTPAEQSLGLQAHTRLDEGNGMLFPFGHIRQACFHQGSVSFPIDIVWARSGRIEKIATLHPGSRDRPAAVASHVIEVPGGFCERQLIRVGDPVNIRPELTRVAANEGYSAPVDRTEPGDHSSSTPPDERFQDRDLAPISDPNATDQHTDLYTNYGYDPTTDRNRQFEGPNYRPSAAKRAQVSVLDSEPTVSDPVAFALGVVSAVGRSSPGNWLHWRPDTLNAGATESVVVTPQMIVSWLKQYGAKDPSILQAASSSKGMEIAGDGLAAATGASLVRFTPDGKSMVLTRTKGK